MTDPIDMANTQGLAVEKTVSPFLVYVLTSALDQPKPRSAQQVRHKHILLAYDAALASLWLDHKSREASC